MRTEHSILEQLAAITVLLSLTGFVLFKPGQLKDISDVLLSISIFVYMASKTIRFWKYLSPRTRIFWIILLIAYLAANYFTFWYDRGMFLFLGIMAIGMFTMSFHRNRKNWLREDRWKKS